MTTCLGKSCSFGLPRVPFVNCCQFMYLVVSLLVLRAGRGIWLYQFLIIAYLFILIIWQKSSLQMHGCLHEMRKCYIFRCAENRCLGCRELLYSLSSIWSSVWHRMLLFFLFFVFFCFFDSDLPSTHCTTCCKWSSYKHRVYPSVRSSVVGP